MKKLLVFLSVAALSCCLLTSCNDGKCDNCGEKAIENDPAISGVEGEYCATCLTAEIGKAVSEVLGDYLQ